MADPVAIISVASSATVAVLTPFLTGHNEQRKLRIEQQRAAEDERRDVLDEAAQRLPELIELTEAWRSPGGRGADYSGWVAAHLAAQRSSARLAIRFGHSSALATAYRNAIEGCSKWMHVEGDYVETTEHQFRELVETAFATFADTAAQLGRPSS